MHLEQEVDFQSGKYKKANGKQKIKGLGVISKKAPGML